MALPLRALPVWDGPQRSPVLHRPSFSTVDLLELGFETGLGLHVLGAVKRASWLGPPG